MVGADRAKPQSEPSSRTPEIELAASSASSLPIPLIGLGSRLPGTKRGATLKGRDPS